MKYKIINKPMVMRSGKISYNLLIHIYDDEGKIDRGASNTLLTLIMFECDGYDVRDLFYDHRTGEPLDNDIYDGNFVDMTIYKDKMRYADAVTKNSGNYYFEGWITKHDFFHIMDKYYKLITVEDDEKGYILATDEMYDTEDVYEEGRD